MLCVAQVDLSALVISRNLLRVRSAAHPSWDLVINIRGVFSGVIGRLIVSLSYLPRAAKRILGGVRPCTAGLTPFCKAKETRFSSFLVHIISITSRNRLVYHKRHPPCRDHSLISYLDGSRSRGGGGRGDWCKDGLFFW